MLFIIAGSRDFNDSELLKSKCIFLLQDKMKQCNVQIICGCARGTDTIGKQFAEEFGLKVLEYPADWKKYGKSAGYRRNKEMAKVADAFYQDFDVDNSEEIKNAIEAVKNAVDKVDRVVNHPEGNSGDMKIWHNVGF